MATFFPLALLAVAAPAWAGAITFNAAFSGPASPAAATQSVYQLKVEGLACPFCAYGVEKQLAAIDGVGAIETDIAAGTVTVTMKAGGALDEATARRAVEAAGFSLRGFEKAPPRE